MFCSRWSGPASLVQLSALLSGFPVVGFSGSRRVVPRVPLLSVLPVLPVGCRVFVGCARGVDAAVRSCFEPFDIRRVQLGLSPQLSVFRAESRSAGALVCRSVGFVRSLAESGGCLISFPGQACPGGLLPSADPAQCFCGLGSGSWASAALAAGLGVPVVVWLPSGVSAPAWGFESLGGGWFVRS